MSILLFILGLFLPLAVVGGIETVFYVIDLIKYRKALRRIKFSAKLEDAKEVVSKEKTEETVEE